MHLLSCLAMFWGHSHLSITKAHTEGGGGTTCKRDFQEVADDARDENWCDKPRTTCFNDVDVVLEKDFYHHHQHPVSYGMTAPS